MIHRAIGKTSGDQNHEENDDLPTARMARLAGHPFGIDLVILNIQIPVR